MHISKSCICSNKLDARNKHLFHTVQQKLRLFLSMQVLRMDGIPALGLWDLVIEVFHSSPNQTSKTKDVREPQPCFL